MGRSISPEEFEKLYGATVRDVLNYVRRRSHRDVEDLVAEVYAVAWRRRNDLPAPMLRRPWLFGVARTLLMADGRHQRRERELICELATRPGPQVGTTRTDRNTTVMAEALARLTPNDREVLTLVAWEGLTPAELAVALGVRPGTARVRLHRARQALALDPNVRDLVEGSVPATTSATV